MDVTTTHDTIDEVVRYACPWGKACMRDSEPEETAKEWARNLFEAARI